MTSSAGLFLLLLPSSASDLLRRSSAGCESSSHWPRCAVTLPLWKRILSSEKLLPVTRAALASNCPVALSTAARLLHKRRFPPPVCFRCKQTESTKLCRSKPLRARRPSCSALQSERSALLPFLDDALSRYLRLQQQAAEETTPARRRLLPVVEKAGSGRRRPAVLQVIHCG